MKIWKKLSLALCMCIAFTGVAGACFQNEDNSSSSSSRPSDSSSSSKPDDSSTITPPDGDSSSAEVDTDAYLIDLYLGMVANTLMKSQSVKVSFDFETKMTTTATNGVVGIGGWTNYLVQGEAFITKTEKGFDVELDVEFPSEEMPGQTETHKYYYIDGYTYLYNAETKVYEKHNETLTTMISNEIHSATQGQYTLETVLAGVAGGIVGGDMSEMPDMSNMSDMSYGKLEEMLSEYVVMNREITPVGIIINADASKKADETFDFVRTIDKNTTYAELLNYCFSFIDKDLTTDSILQDLYPRGKDTVSDLVQELEEKSVAKTGKGLQENLDTLLNSGMMQDLLTSLGPKLADKIKGFKIDNFLNQDSSIVDSEGVAIKYGDLTLNKLSQEFVEVLVAILGEDSPLLGDLGLLSKNINWGLVIGAVEMVLEGKALEKLPENGIILKLLKKAQAVYVDKAGATFEVKVNTKNIDSFIIGGVFVGKTSENGLSATIGATLNMTVSDFRTTALEIALPEDATVVIVYHTCNGCTEAKEDVVYYQEHCGYYCGECFEQFNAETIE